MVGLLDLPTTMQTRLGNNPTGSIVVRRLNYNDYKIIKPGNHNRAAVSQEISTGYDLALAILSGDI